MILEKKFYTVQFMLMASFSITSVIYQLKVEPVGSSSNAASSLSSLSRSSCLLILGCSSSRDLNASPVLLLLQLLSHQLTEVKVVRKNIHFLGDFSL